LTSPNPDIKPGQSQQPPELFQTVLLPVCCGILILILIAAIQHLFVFKVQLRLINFLIPTVVGAASGFCIGLYNHRINLRQFKLQATIEELESTGQHLRETENRLQTIIDSVHTGIMVIDPETHTIVDANTTAIKMIGTDRDSIIGSECHEFVCPAMAGKCPITDLKQTMDNEERTLVTASGNRVPILKRVVRLTLNGRPHLLESFLDLSDRKRAEEAVEQLAYFDLLTGLPNRALLKDRLNQAISLAKRSDKKISVLFLDVDRFKQINDTLGHSAGDRLLEMVALRLQSVVRKSDTVSRLGGDEFVIIVPDSDQAEDAAKVAHKIQGAMASPFPLNDQEIFTSSSIGIAMYPANGETAEALLKNADTAMYSSKKEGGNGYCFYSKEMNQRAVQRLALEGRLRRSLARGDFLLHYQPQINLVTGCLVGMEALLRWNCPEEGAVSPADFIPLAEETGLIIPLGEWVLEQACKQAAEWHKAGLFPIRMAVNISGKQFHQRSFADAVVRILSGVQIPRGALELELTESTLTENPPEVAATLKHFKEMGIKLAIDDFGTGYSSLSYLKLFPIDRIKIAQEFVRDIITDLNDAGIAEAVIAMGHSLGLEVIAEGVENEDQQIFLQLRGCDEAQGFYYSRPLSADKATELLRKATGSKGAVVCWHPVHPCK
jgi:diguanylate cyclase (GGDEF)-like protein/PAS domain S-box-containing protein